MAAFDRDYLSWRDRAVEPIVHQALHGLADTRDALEGVVSVGSWWDRTGQHDYDVALGASDHTGGPSPTHRRVVGTGSSNGSG